MVISELHALFLLDLLRSTLSINKPGGQMCVGLRIWLVNGQVSSGTLHSQCCGTFLDFTILLLVNYYALSPSIGMTQGEFIHTTQHDSNVVWHFQSHFSVHEQLCHGVEEVTTADLPSFLWLKGSFDMVDPYKGFLWGPLVVIVWLILNSNLNKLTMFDRHISMSSYLQAPQGTLTGQHMAMLHCMVLNLSHMSQLLMLQCWSVCQCHVCLCSHHNTDAICAFQWGNIWPWWCW